MWNTKDINQVKKYSFYCKVLPAKINDEKLSPCFAFRTHDVIQHPFRKTTKLSKFKIHYPMRCHLKNRFQMSRHESLNKVIATDTYFANEKSIEGYHCAQVIFQNDLKNAVCYRYEN
jgi:hypothetical protein